MRIDIDSVYNPSEESRVVKNEDKIRSMPREELARLSVTPVLLGSYSNIWTMYRGPFLALTMIQEKKQNAVN